MYYTNKAKQLWPENTPRSPRECFLRAETDEQWAFIAAVLRQIELDNRHMPRETLDVLASWRDLALRRAVPIECRP